MYLRSKVNDYVNQNCIFVSEGRERKLNSDYEQVLTSRQSMKSSSTLSFTTGSLYGIHSNDSLLDNAEEHRNHKLTTHSSHPALSWSTPNIQFSCQSPLKCTTSTNSLQTSRGKKSKGAHKTSGFKNLGSPVLLAWHLILLVTILHGNTSCIIPILEKLIC